MENNNQTILESKIEELNSKYNKLRGAFDWADKRILECEEALKWDESESFGGHEKRYGIEQELNTLNRMKRIAGLSPKLNKK